MDPLYTDPESKDFFPKVRLLVDECSLVVLRRYDQRYPYNLTLIFLAASQLGLDGQYIGDGYPLCTDLPSKHYLKAGARFRLLGSSPYPELLNDPSPLQPSWRSEWNGGPPVRVTLDGGSNLAKKLCGGSVDNCQPVKSVVTLTEDLSCVGMECDIAELRSFEVAPDTDIWFEYVRPACVNLAFYRNAKTIFRNWYDDKFMCGDPESLDASTVCCPTTNTIWPTKRKSLFSGERVSYATAEARCTAETGKGLCGGGNYPWISDCSNPSQGGCDQWNMFYWTFSDCTQYIKIDGDGSVAIVHKHGLPDVGNSYSE